MSKYGHCMVCGASFSKYSVVCNGLCRMCLENKELKTMANKKCERCKGEGFTIYQEKNMYPIEWYNEIKIKCPCTEGNNV